MSKRHLGGGGEGGVETGLKALSTFSILRRRDESPNKKARKRARIRDLNSFNMKSHRDHVRLSGSQAEKKSSHQLSCCLVPCSLHFLRDILNTQPEPIMKILASFSYNARSSDFLCNVAMFSAINAMIDQQ